MISKLLFFGDSITAANRIVHNDLGDGYVSILSELFSSDNQLKDIQFINSGINGHNVGDLLQRYKQDVLDYHPDVVVIKIGINDAYNDYISKTDEGKVHIYEAGLERLIHSLNDGLPKADLILFTPYLISDSQQDAFYLKMNEYCEVVKGLGAKYGLPVLDIQSVFDAAVRLKSAREWADDQIHPHREGHALIAGAAFRFLRGHLLKI